MRRAWVESHPFHKPQGYKGEAAPLQSVSKGIMKGIKRNNLKQAPLPQTKPIKPGGITHPTPRGIFHHRWFRDEVTASKLHHGTLQLLSFKGFLWSLLISRLQSQLIWFFIEENKLDYCSAAKQCHLKIHQTPALHKGDEVTRTVQNEIKQSSSCPENSTHMDTQTAYLNIFSLDVFRQKSEIAQNKFNILG